MNKPLVIFRLGWMEDYSGIDEIIGGGAHIEENGEGGEMWNFRDEAGRHYGYVMTKNFAGIDLHRILPEENWETGNEGVGIDIVFISTDPEPNIGQVIVGWYKDATIFHKEYRSRRGTKGESDWDSIDYLSEVDSDNAVLLDLSERRFIVPRGKGYPGQSNVWYGDNGTSEVEHFKAEVRSYIEKLNKSKPAQGRKHKKPNKSDVLSIEKAAVNLSWNHYFAQGYDLKSVEKDNVGWDLEATKGTEKLLIEVKGHKGNTIQFELTPNEYAQMQNNKQNYRVCVVRNALNAPDLTEFSVSEDDYAWYLEQVNGSEVVRLDEKVAAKAVQIGF